MDTHRIKYCTNSPVSGLFIYKCYQKISNIVAFCTHITHKKIMSALIKLLNNKYNIHSTVVKAQTSGLTVLDENSAFPPDAIISAGN